MKRENNNGRNPEADLRNVLAGYHVIKPTNPVNDALSETFKLDGKEIQLHDLHALPQADGSFGATDVLLNQYKNEYEKIFQNNNAINNKTINDHEDLKDIYMGLHKFNRSKNSTNPEKADRITKKQFDRVLEYMTFKHRIEFEKNYPLRIEANDSPAQIKIKVADKNQAFQKEMLGHKQKIFRAINQALKPETDLPVNSNAIEDTLKYMKRVFNAAATYEGNFREQKKQIEQHAAEVAGTFNYVNPTDSLNQLTGQKQGLELKFNSIREECKNDAERAAFNWKLKDHQLEKKWHRNPTADNQTKLNQHRNNRPVNYEQQNIGAQFQKAKPTLNKIANIEEQEEIIQPEIAAYKLAENEIQIKSLKENIARSTGNIKSEDEIQKDIEKLIEGKLILADHDQAAIKTNNMLRQAANLQKEVNEITKDNPNIRNNACYKLAKENITYQATMGAYANPETLGNNPHPNTLRNAQLVIEKVRIDHQKAVMAIHKEAGSDKLLNKISAPLNAIRDTGSTNRTIRSVVNSSNITRALAQNQQTSTRLPVLKTHDYELNGETPKILSDIEKRTTSINNLLQQQELLERQLQGNPGLAKSAGFRKKVADNTDQLQTEMNQLAKLTNRASTYLTAHPDVNEYVKKATRLQKALDRTLQNNRRFQAAVRGGLLGRLQNGLRRDSTLAQPINPNIRYNPNAGEELERSTVFSKEFVRVENKWGGFKWVARDITVKINGIEEKVKFNKAELMDHFENFCEEHGIRDGQVKFKEIGKKVIITWPKGKAGQPGPYYKDLWVKYLKDKYLEKRKAEEDTASTKAEATVERQNDGEAVSASPVNINNIPPQTSGLKFESEENEEKSDNSSALQPN